MIYLLYQHSQYTAFYHPNKTEVMIITPGKSVTDLKISKTDVKALLTQRFLTFRCVPCLKIKDTDDVSHVKEDPQLP